MGIRLSFKGSGEGHVSRIRPEIGWTHVVISRGQKLTTIDAPSTFLFGMRSGTRPRELSTPRTLRVKEGSRLLELGLGLPVSLRFLSFCGVPLQADKALNARLICCRDGPVNVTLMGVALEIGETYQGRWFRYDSSQHCKFLIEGLHKF